MQDLKAIVTNNRAYGYGAASVRAPYWAGSLTGETGRQFQNGLRDGARGQNERPAHLDFPKSRQPSSYP